LWTWEVAGGRLAAPAVRDAASDVTESNAVQLWSNINLALECGGDK